MSRIIRRPAANRDVVTIFRQYALEAGIRVADRFFAVAEATFARLASTPGMGTRYVPEEPLRHFREKRRPVVTALPGEVIPRQPLATSVPGSL